MNGGPPCPQWGRRGWFSRRKADVERWDSDEESGDESGGEEEDESAVLCLSESAIQMLMQ